MRLLVLACTAASLLVVASANAAPRPVSEDARSGDVRAQLTFRYDPTGNDPRRQFTNLHLRIDRAGVTLVDADVEPPCRECEAWPLGGGDPSTPSIHALDLDGDGEPEVLLDLYSGGAHCCGYTSFYRYVGGEYVRMKHGWGNGGYRIVHPLGEGQPELRTADDRFEYAFSCFACSAAPVVIDRYSQGRLLDVTRRFPNVLRADAARIWSGYRSAVRHRYYPSGVLPAYLADEVRLGHAAAGWRRVRAAVARRDWPSMVDPRWKNRQRYLRTLGRFLHRTGYIR
jgi:hypothetical protein